MHVAAVWVVVAFIDGVVAGIVVAALRGASKVARAESITAKWRLFAAASERSRQLLRADLLRLLEEQQAAMRCEELAAVLADGVAEGPRPMAAPAGDKAEMADNQAAYMETVAAAEQGED